MPIYEYACQACGCRFSHLAGVTADAGEPTCPQCGGRDLTKLISRFATFRGEEENWDEDLGPEDDELKAGDEDFSGEGEDEDY